MKIAIDGPAGAGKSTIAKKLALYKGYTYIDTGAMYRALTWKALQNRIDMDQEGLLAALAETTDISLVTGALKDRVFCDGFDVTELIRSPQVNACVALVSSHTGVRTCLVRMQRRLADMESVVMEGRDIGENVLPDADFKFFLTANPEERARRRQEELIRQGYEASVEEILRQLRDRDRQDALRETGALKILPDSIVIDTSNLSVEQVLEEMSARIEGKAD